MCKSSNAVYIRIKRWVNNRYPTFLDYLGIILVLILLLRLIGQRLLYISLSKQAMEAKRGRGRRECRLQCLHPPIMLTTLNDQSLSYYDVLAPWCIVSASIKFWWILFFSRPLLKMRRRILMNNLTAK